MLWVTTSKTEQRRTFDGCNQRQQIADAAIDRGIARARIQRLDRPR